MKTVRILNKASYINRDGIKINNYYFITDYYDKEKHRHRIEWKITSSTKEYEILDEINVEYNSYTKKYEIIDNLTEDNFSFDLKEEQS